MAPDDAENPDVTDVEETDVEETQPGEKGPPAWQVRHTTGEPIPDEPPDSSSEVAQVSGLFYDEDGDDEESSD